VPGHRPVAGLGGPLGDVDGAPQLALAVHHRQPARPAPGPAAAQVPGQLLAQRPPGPGQTATGRSSHATRASPGHRDSSPSANPRSAPATSAAPACSRRPCAAADTGTARRARDGAPGEAPAGQRHTPGTGLLRHWPPPPGTPSRGHAPARWRSPATTGPPPVPLEISSRSASDNRSGERFGSRLAGRCNAITARRMAHRDRLISRCNRHTGAPLGQQFGDPPLLVRDSIHATPPPKIQPDHAGRCVDPLRPSPVLGAHCRPPVRQRAWLGRNEHPVGTAAAGTGWRTGSGCWPPPRICCPARRGCWRRQPGPRGEAMSRRPGAQGRP
jgi:hypothetical protein